MKKEQAEIIVKAINTIAKANAKIELSLGFDGDKEKLIHNVRVLEEWKKDLVEFLIKI